MFSRLMMAIIVVICLCAGEPVLAQVGFGAMPDPLKSAKWNKRILAVCKNPGTPEEKALLNMQYEMIDWAGYLERDLMLVEVAPDHLYSITVLPNPTKDATIASQWHTDDETGIRMRIGCTGDAEFLALIGKDGGVKARWSSLVSNQELFALIDSMPMRQQEQRDKQK